MKTKSHSLIGVIMGSKSDWKTMIHCSNTLKEFSIKHEAKVISAHRTPTRLHKFLNDAKKNKIDANFINLAHSTNLKITKWVISQIFKYCLVFFLAILVL